VQGAAALQLSLFLSLVLKSAHRLPPLGAGRLFPHHPSAGQVVGRALYDGLLLPVAFAPFFAAAALQGRRPGFDDLAAYDGRLHTSLQQARRPLCGAAACRRPRCRLGRKLLSRH
jgi:hypothetical protein